MSYLGQVSPRFGAPLSTSQGIDLINSAHAISVSLCRTGGTGGVGDLDQLGTVDYEEGRKEAIEAMEAGYSRFRVPTQVEELANFYKTTLPDINNDEIVYIYPLEEIAAAAVAYAKAGRIVFTGTEEGSHCLAVFPHEKSAEAKQFWQHTGLGISSRQAEDITNKKIDNDRSSADLLRERLAGLYELENAGDVYLFSSGITAFFNAYKSVITRKNTKVVQFGMAYMDTLKIPERFGPGSIFAETLDKLEEALRSNNISAIILEVPSNPLLQTPDLEKLRQLAEQYHVPVIIDDTVATIFNIDARQYADIVVTSLTKATTGSADVLAGSAVLNPKSPFYNELKPSLDQAPQTLYPRDVRRVVETSEGFEQRVRKMNENAAQLAAFLRSHDMVDQVYYTDQDPNYAKAKRKGAGGGCLLSFTLKDPELMAAFYDILECAKGPSLGTEFTLVGQYALLAHYNELPQIERKGIRPDILRVSVGIEDPDRIIEVFRRAFENIREQNNINPASVRRRPWQLAYDRALVA
jgi:cystathionine gamma-synthase